MTPSLPRHKLLTLIIAILLLVVGCSAGGGPAIDATRAWFQALSELDFDGVLALTCSNVRVRNSIEARLDPFIDLKGALDALQGQFDFTGLKFEEKSNDGRTAVIHLSGQMELRALGQAEALEVFEDITVVNEGGTWKVCANPLNIR